MIRDLLSFLNTKTILSKKYKHSISEDEYREIEPQSFIYRIVFGDLLKLPAIFSYVLYQLILKQVILFPEK